MLIYHQKANTIEHFDSYGYTYQQEIGHTSNQFARRNLLGDLYNKAMDDGVNVICNPCKLQQMKSDISTCGRWCGMRCRFNYLSIHEFAKLFMKQKMAPDWLVSCMTFLTLREDEQEEEEIIRKTTKIHNCT